MPRPRNDYRVLDRVQNHIRNPGLDLGAGLVHGRKHRILVHTPDLVQDPVLNHEVGPVHVHRRAVGADALYLKQQVNFFYSKVFFV